MSKSTYVDGFVIPLPKIKLAQYKKIAQIACKMYMKYGALQYVEAVADDLSIPFGIPFNKLAKTKPSETVIFAWITYKSKAQRNAINKKIIKDPQMGELCEKIGIPFDMKRLSMAGFRIIV